MKLPLEFYTREDVLQVAKDLLGKYIVTNFDNEISAGMIVETEAYRAPDDKACHAYNNLKTKRTQTMFEQGGVAYVYLCYGIHHLFNVVTAKKGMAHAVLIRAIQPSNNIELQLERRGFSELKRQLTAGPGVLSKALGISTTHNGVNLVAKHSPIWLEDRDIDLHPNEIIASPRIGVSYAEECALWNWRFTIKDSKWISKPVSRNKTI